MGLFFQLAGFRVTMATSGAEVLGNFATEHFDAVVLDNWMPDSIGLDLCKQIRLGDSNTPIFFCSGLAHDSDIQAATEAGAQGYFSKPYDPDELIDTLRTTLRIS